MRLPFKNPWQDSRVQGAPGQDGKDDYGTLPDGTPGHKPGTPQNPYVQTGDEYGPDPGWVYNHNTNKYEMADGTQIPGDGGYDPSGPPGARLGGGEGASRPSGGFSGWGR